MDLDEFQAVLDRITFADILRAVADCHDDDAPPGFRPASGWCLRIAGRELHSRRVVSVRRVGHVRQRRSYRVSGAVGEIPVPFW